MSEERDINLILTKAIEVTNYNESIQLKLNDTGNDMILLMPSLDKINGGIQWNNALETTSDTNKDILLSFHFRTKSWIVPMLNDVNRNNAYEKSISNSCLNIIRSKIKKMNENDTNAVDINVIDIGSGTGLLAMIAASYLLKYSKQFENYIIHFTVTSLEMSDAMVQLSQDIIKYNDLNAYITVLNQHSNEHELSSDVDLITCELLDTTVVGEGIIPTLHDILSRLSNNDTIILPNRLKVYGMILSGPESITCYKSDVFGTSQYIPIRIPAFLQQNDIIQLSSSPLLLYDAGFSSLDALKQSLNDTIASFVSSNDGVAHGIAYWFEFELPADEKEPYCYNTWEEIHNQDHWRHCLYIFDENESFNCAKDTEYSIITKYDDNEFSFTIQEKNQSIDDINNITSEKKATISPQRILQLNDSSYLSSLHRIIRDIHTQYNIITINTSESTTIVDLSDYGICSMLASKIFTDNVSIHSVQTDMHNLHIPSSVFVHHMYPDQIINHHTTLFDNKSIDILVNEPYVSKLDGYDIIQAINLYYTIRGLVAKDNNDSSEKSRLFSPNALVCPQKTCVKASIIQFDLFSKAYNINLSNLCNDMPLDHTLVNTHTSSKNDIVLPLWQYDYTILTDPFCLHTFDYQQLVSNKDGTGNVDNGWVNIPFINEGTCHALLTWVEYGYYNSSSAWSTLHKNHMQSLRILPNDMKNKIITKNDMKKMNHEQKYMRCRMMLGNGDIESTSLENQGREFDYEFEFN